MAVTENSYTGNGSTTNYSFTFPYLKSTDVQVQVDATVTTAWTFANATTVQFNTAPSNGAKIKILRDTNVDSLAATFYAGSSIKSEDLNDNYTQNLYKTQEVGNRYFSTTGGTMTGDLTLGEDVTLTFEGATDNAHETKLTVADPTADRTITFPDTTGTVVTTGDTGTVAHAMLAGNAVDGDNIADDSINSEHYINGSIDTQHIADSQITTAKIADSNVTTAKIANQSVTEDKIANNAVGSSELKDNAVDTAALQNNSVTSAKIADGNVTTPKLGTDSVTTAKIVDGNITLAKMADDSVGTAELVDGSVDTARLADNSVTLAKMTDSSVGTAELVNAGVTTAKIASSAVTEAKIASSAVTNSKVAQNAIQTGNIVDSAIQSTKIADSNVTSGKLADGSVTTPKLGTDSVTTAKIVDSNVTTAKLADAELKTLAGMQSGTASKLAGSTALTADIADLNQIDGLTKQTTISDSDASFPTSGAVVDYVAAQIAPLGGLEVIATEVAFPNTQPSAGVVISISDAGGVVFNGSGTSTTGRTVGGSTVTINNAPSSLNNETLAAGVGLMVSSTGSSQTYNYHKILGKEDDIKQLSDDINDFNARYRVGSSNPTSALDNGDLFFNTGTGKMLVYNGTNTAWEEVQSIGNFYISTFSESFNGTRTEFTLSNAPTNAQQLILSINGVIQKPNSGTSAPSEGFALDGSTVKLSNAPATGSAYFAVVMGSTVNIGTPSNNTVTTDILQNGSVTTAKIVDAQVTTAKIAADAVNGTKIADNSIGAEHIISGSVTSSKLGGNSVLTSKLADGAVTTGKLGSEVVTNLKVADNAINEQKLQVSNSPTNGYFLSAQSGNTGGMTWAQVNTDLVGDTSPQLGGNLDLNSNHLTGILENRKNDTATDFTVLSNPALASSGISSQNIQGAFNVFNALTLVSHSANSVGMSGSFIVKNHSGSGYSPSVFITHRNGSNSQRILQEMTNAGACKLNYDGSTKLETTANGIIATGNDATGNILIGDLRLKQTSGDTTYIKWDASHSKLEFMDNVYAMFGDQNDLKVYHNGSDGFVQNPGTGGLRLESDQTLLRSADSSETYISTVKNGAVQLYYDNSIKFQTTTNGVNITNNHDIRLESGTWTGETCKIQHHGNWLYFQGGSNGFKFRHSDGTNRWIIDGSGHFRPNANNSYDIGTSSERVRNIYTNDLHLSNQGSSNDMDGTWGDWTIQEGESDLFLKNNRSGKKYKFNLTEVS